jgi:predicted nucleotidyltransferase
MEEERLLRRVTEIGNGAHIFAPKEWLDEEVIIIRIPKKNTREEILKLISPHLDKINAVFLYGSYARGEQTSNSDLDVFIVSSEKFTITSKEAEIIVIPEDKLKTAVKLNPILFYSMLNEAKPIINASYLEKLKKEKINFTYFKSFLEDTENLIKINDSEINLDKSDKFASASVVYSLILRLRGIFLINLLYSKKSYSKARFKEFLEENSTIIYEDAYEAYLSIRDSKKINSKTEIKTKISISQASSLLNLLTEETKKLKAKLSKK